MTVTPPLHFLCANNKIEDSDAVDILGLFVERFPEAARYAGEGGVLPVHKAAGQGSKSLEFCRMLIETYPGSEKIATSEGATTSGGVLPLHLACRGGTVETVQYLLRLYPESVNTTNGHGAYPIHYAMEGLRMRDNPDPAIEMVQFLLDCNPNAVLQKYEGNLPLYWVCKIFDVFDAWLDEGGSKIAQVLYDARPEAIFEDGYIARDLRTFPEEIQAFINTQTQLNLALELVRNAITLDFRFWSCRWRSL